MQAVEEFIAGPEEGHQPRRTTRREMARDGCCLLRKNYFEMI